MNRIYKCALSSDEPDSRREESETSQTEANRREDAQKNGKAKVKAPEEEGRARRKKAAKRPRKRKLQARRGAANRNGMTNQKRERGRMEEREQRCKQNQGGATRGGYSDERRMTPAPRGKKQRKERMTAAMKRATRKQGRQRGTERLKGAERRQPQGERGQSPEETGRRAGSKSISGDCHYGR